SRPEAQPKLVRINRTYLEFGCERPAPSKVLEARIRKPSCMLCLRDDIRRAASAQRDKLSDDDGGLGSRTAVRLAPSHHRSTFNRGSSASWVTETRSTVRRAGPPRRPRQAFTQALEVPAG